MIEGLEEAARTARIQADICRRHGHGETADTMEAFARTLDSMALAWPDEAPTDPDVEYQVVLMVPSPVVDASRIPPARRP